MERRILLRKSEHSYLIGWGVEAEFKADAHTSADQMDEFIANHNEQALFFCLSYELGFQLLDLETNPLKNRSQLPLAQIWQPLIVAELSERTLTILKGKPNAAFNQWISKVLNPTFTELNNLDWKALTSKTEYLKDVTDVLHEIQLGNCYELNYCMRFEATTSQEVSGFDLFKQLDEKTNAPQAFYYEDDQTLVASASPERFIQKSGSTLLSQPIKGTAKRGATPKEDEQIASDLIHSLKDTTENVMIVDLVRNDLSKIATRGSVQVTALNALHTFETVHQLISTVQCEVKPGTTFSEIVKALFPMGSMTGAPKKAAVQLSERYEHSARNWYSGSFGHITPNGDFDSNVVIRTIFFDKKEKQFSCMVGGAITYLSDPEEEWEECKTKVGKILDLFGTCNW